MNPEDIGKILDEVGQRIGPAGEFAFEAAVQYKVAEAVSAIALVSVVLLIGLGLLLAGLPRASWGDSATRWDIITIAGGVLTTFGGMAFVIGVGTWVPNLLVPEYAVIKELIGVVR